MAVQPTATDELISWLHERGMSVMDTSSLLEELHPRMATVGFPLVRVWHAFALSHPLFEGQSWYLNDGEVTSRELPLGFFANTPTDRMGPASFIARGKPHFWARAADGPSEYDVVNELFERGATDYIAFPIAGTGTDQGPREAHQNTATGVRSHGFGLTAWAVRVEGGVDEVAFAALRRIHHAFSMASLLQLERRRTRTILHTYLGRDSGEKVDMGLVHRGDRTTLEAAIAFTDLRGFSSTSETHDPDAVLDLLNDTFEAQVGAIEAQGGHVLAFLGDGLLAIFPDDEADARGAACDRALAATRDLDARIARANADRLAAGKLEIRYGVALHFGEVFYGNIGAAHRLTFTVIGPAVNRAARLESLGGRLGIRPALSDAFAARTSARCVRHGTYAAKGVGELEVWTLADEA